MNGIWALKPYSLGPWTFRVRSEIQSGILLRFSGDSARGKRELVPLDPEITHNRVLVWIWEYLVSLLIA